MFFVHFFTFLLSVIVTRNGSTFVVNLQLQRKQCSRPQHFSCVFLLSKRTRLLMCVVNSYNAFVVTGNRRRIGSKLFHFFDPQNLWLHRLRSHTCGYLWPLLFPGMQNTSSKSLFSGHLLNERSR
jgi:hypothetical protein